MYRRGVTLNVAYGVRNTRLINVQDMSGVVFLFFCFSRANRIPSKLLTKQKASKQYLSSDKAESKH